jgi:hypothetical protein
MSVAEMKLAAINEISKLQDESAVKEILEHLVRISTLKKKKVFNLSQHYNKVKEQYGNVLQKLAQ